MLISTPETVEELLQALISETANNAASSEKSSGIALARDDDDSGFDLEVSELDISALYSLQDEGRYRIWRLFLTPPNLDTATDSRHDAPFERARSAIVGSLGSHSKPFYFPGMSSWMKEYVLKRDIPIPQLLLAFGMKLCSSLETMSPTTLLYFLRVAMSRELQLRDKLPNYNTVEDAVQLIRDSRRIVILTGAGISVSCGIPDFRSRDGLYASLKERGEYDLDDPQQMFDINYFRENPAESDLSRPILSRPVSRFIKLVEDKNQLLRNYTQNIDTLETLAVSWLIRTASCLLCRRQVPGSEIEADILAQKVPLCTTCNAPGRSAQGKLKGKKKSAKKAKGGWDSDEEDESDGPTYPPGIMKPDITFFGEKLTDHFDHSLSQDRSQVDLLLVIGTSLKVSPVADILSHLPHSVPQILINKTPVKHINPDIVLLGNADDTIAHLLLSLDGIYPQLHRRLLRLQKEKGRQQTSALLRNHAVWVKVMSGYLTVRKVVNGCRV
ncbi:DHS-like NAD/FAD-binding domain-containing protein [Mycena sp. CBHHK59/15]|nr:DHS-like NAD/FAD-binding domain-containing protein [Mycena sp. CBHHK59/15]